MCLAPSCALESTYVKNVSYVFTALHGMQTRSSDEITVCPSVSLSGCPSVKRVNCDKTERVMSRFLYHTKDHLA